MFVGPSETVIPAEIRYEDGLFRCVRSVPDSAGLAIQVPIGRAAGPGSGPEQELGTLMLRSTLLPDQDTPYMLLLELARHRLMLVLNKMEAWELFDLPPDDAVAQRLEQARSAFGEALVAVGAAAGSDATTLRRAEAAAARALAVGVDASEALALAQAWRVLRARADGSLFQRALARADTASDRSWPDSAIKVSDEPGLVLPTPAAVGCTVNPDGFSEQMASVVLSTCDFVSVPMRWVDLEPTEGKYAFGATDRWIEWAVRSARLPVHAGPLLDFSDASLPEWLYIWEHDYETLREMVYEHLRTVVTRYRRTVARWTVCSGIHAVETFGLSVERMLDLTRLSVLLVRKLHPAAKVQIEITQPWGENLATNRRALAPRLFAELVLQAGIDVDAIALRVQMGQAARGRWTRDLAWLSDLLDRYGELDRPIVVSALGVPSSMCDPAGGTWRGPWSEVVQARWLAEAMTVCAGKPFVHSVCWQDLWDGGSAVAMPSGGLLAPDGTRKPAVAALTQVRAALGRTRARLPASPR